MWYQNKEFAENREADRLARATRGGVLAAAIIGVPLALLLVWLVAGWLGLTDEYGRLPIRAWLGG